jgi:hypothetical protein
MEARGEARGRTIFALGPQDAQQGCGSAAETFVSRPNSTDEVVDGLDFARACVLDQRAASHKRKDHGWDKRYDAALDAINFIVRAHKLTAKKAAKTAKTPKVKR